MCSYRARHRQPPESLGSVKRAATTVSFGVLATAAVAGTSAAAWACPSGSHAHTRASVHHAVVHDHGSAAGTGATFGTHRHAQGAGEESNGASNGGGQSSGRAGENGSAGPSIEVLGEHFSRGLTAAGTAAAGSIAASA